MAKRKLWTVTEVKAELPQVKVQVSTRKTVWGRITGRLNPFATVTVTNEAVGGQTPWYDWQFSWEAIVHALNNDTALRVD